MFLSGTKPTSHRAFAERSGPPTGRLHTLHSSLANRSNFVTDVQALSGMLRIYIILSANAVLWLPSVAPYTATKSHVIQTHDQVTKHDNIHLKIAC